MGGAVGRDGGGMKGELGPMSDWGVWVSRAEEMVRRDVGPARPERMAPLVRFVGEWNWRE